MSYLSSSLIESQALLNAESQAQTILDAWTLYSSAAVERIEKIKGITVTHNYLVKDGAIPIPATYAIELGKNLSQDETGFSVRLYSDYPFPWRKAKGGPKNDFERKALDDLSAHPEKKEFYQIDDGLLQYGRAVIMKATCVGCHNTRSDSPKKDWQVGDVRGVFSITQNLDNFTGETNKSIQITSFMLGGLSLLGISGISLVMGRLRQTANELEVRVRQRTIDLAVANTDLEKRNLLICQVFGRYLSDEIVANLLESPQALKLGGQRCKVTILASDLRGFTTISERLSAEEVIHVLNIYLEYMADVITQYQGSINEFMGDGILVLFGAPTKREDDAVRAIACACAMQLAMGAVNQRLKDLDFPQLEMGIGINTGLVVLGNIGSDKRAKYGIVGNDVNLTYRIESYTTGGQILISQETLKAAGSIVRVGRQKQEQMKGIKEPITIYEVYGITGFYNLFLSREEEVFFNIPKPIPIQYMILNGKHISENVFTANLIHISHKGAKVRTENGENDFVPPALTNLKLNLLTPDNSSRYSEDIYAKVLQTSAEDGTFYIHFTATPPVIQTKFEALYKSLNLSE
ncbi:MAG: adenylate/guanylate cyclase domain-containing protein [Nostoc sp.]